MHCLLLTSAYQANCYTKQLEHITMKITDTHDNEKQIINLIGPGLASGQSAADE